MNNIAVIRQINRDDRLLSCNRHEQDNGRESCMSA